MPRGVAVPGTVAQASLIDPSLPLPRRTRWILPAASDQWMGLRRCRSGFPWTLDLPTPDKQWLQGIVTGAKERPQKGGF
jgi:hypothetical protein